jgi:hypothetical protein
LCAGRPSRRAPGRRDGFPVRPGLRRGRCETGAGDIAERRGTLLILYELAPGTDEAAAFLDALSAYGGHQLTANSQLVTTSRAAADVLEDLAAHLSGEDRLVVVEPARVGWCNVEEGHLLFDELTRSAG